MIPLLPLATTAILFYPSASPALLAKSVIDESRQGVVVAGTVDGNQQVLDAYRARQSDVIVENVVGVVERLLADDNEGSRHQRFIMRMGNGNTLLVVHNIDLAPRIDSLRVGDRISVKGEYEWNDRGGLVHWTHHDPRGVHEGGWIDHEGWRYQ
ncbi:MAG: DUF3465 domain-containing protein [Phormidesmis sp.]